MTERGDGDPWGGGRVGVTEVTVCRKEGVIWGQRLRWD